MSDQRKKLALISGGAKGIGKSISEKLATEGWDLFLCARDPAALTSIATKIHASSGRKVDTHALDLSQVGASKTLFRRWDENPSMLPDAMVCNSGDYGVLGQIAEVDFQAWKKSFDLNFFSVVEMVQDYVRVSKKSPLPYRRKIILMSGSGLGGAKVWGGTAAYSCAKAALYRLVEVLHEEVYESGIDVNCIAPGAVKTGITDQAVNAGQSRLGGLYQATLNVLSSGGDSPELAANMIAQLLGKSCDGVSGRLWSAKWDRRFIEQADAVQKDPDLLRLRRIDNELFEKVKKS